MVVPTTTAVSGVPKPENKIIHCRCVVHKQESRHKAHTSVLRTLLGRMQFTLYATR